MSEQARGATTNCTGIIGLGNLGRRLATQELLSGNGVLAYEANPQAVFEPGKPIDPALGIDALRGAEPEPADTADILRGCRVVHWAIAAKKLDELPEVPEDCTIVLHDSVMSNSLRALEDRPDKGRFVIAHCIMNEDRRVLVSYEAGDHETIAGHFKAIGLAPESTSVMAHDMMMAHSQGMFALMIKAGLREELDKIHAAGNLTPSASELRDALIHREARWTPQTIESILSNPYIHLFTDKMAEIAKDFAKQAA